MVTAEMPGRAFVILTANNSELAERALNSVLEGSGYEVLAAHTGSEALALARSARPDAVLVESTLPDMSGLEVCQRLSGDAAFPSNCPIFLLSTHGSSKEERHASLGAGAWELCSQPLDGEALLLKLQIYLRARRVAERLRQRGLMDDETGLYTMRGLRTRVAELGADAVRRHGALACIAVSPELQDDPGSGVDAAAARRVAVTCRRHTRASDAVGWVGATEFVVIATGADAASAARITERLQASLDGGDGTGARAWPAVTLRAECCASANLAEAPLLPEELLLGAIDALARGADPPIA